jgi:succinyldiaminopimelate transaminase
VKPPELGDGVTLTRRPVSAALPVFPWDTLADASAVARAHPDGIVDLSVGTPVDPVAPRLRDALAAGSASSGYPTTAGTPALREAAVAALARRYRVTGVPADAVLPVIGSKELIAWLPTLLGLGAADVVVVPELAYPTYEVGARLAGTRILLADSLTQLGPRRPSLIYLNSPSNPTGRVLGADHLRKVVGWARERGALVASDECYIGLGWDVEPVSLLDPVVCDGDHTGLLAIHSLSKSSSMAGYRAGFVAGDPAVVAELLAVRRHAGMMVPTPVQSAMVAALSDDTHEREQRDRYARRRDTLLPAVREAGLTVDHSEAGLYLWATRDEPCRDTVAWFAQRGILVAPGEFYGPRGGRHVRIALTATDERIAAAASRLAAQSPSRSATLL